MVKSSGFSESGANFEVIDLETLLYEKQVKALEIALDAVSALCDKLQRENKELREFLGMVSSDALVEYEETVSGRSKRY